MDKIDPRDEKLEKELDKLFADWRRAISDKDLKRKFIVDGALPGYFKRKTKILLIAWEMHTTKGLKKYPEKRNIVKFVDAFLSGCRDSSDRSSEAYAVTRIKERKCWKLAARIAYSVLQGDKIGLLGKLSPKELQKKLEEVWTKPSFEELQSAYNKNKLSFAILEISKYNNVVKSTNAPSTSGRFYDSTDQGLGMNDYDSQENFIRREIELLNPNLIITWNLRAKLHEERFRKLLIDDPNHEDKTLKRSCNFLRGRAWTYTFNKRRDASTREIKQIPLLDTWHFSPRGKSRETDIYYPIMRAVKKLGLI